MGTTAVALAVGGVLPPASAAADELGLPLTWTASPGRLQVTAVPADGVLEVLLDDQVVARAVHASGVTVDVRYGSSHVPRLETLLNGHHCTTLRGSLDGAGAVSVHVSGFGDVAVDDATRRTLRLRLC